MQHQRTVLITGASSGIGRVTALLLARRGWHVFGGVRSESDADALREAVPGRITPVQLDITIPEQVRAAVAQVEAVVGQAGLDGLVNNAGIGRAAPLEFVPLETLRQQLEVNVTAQVMVTQAFLPLLRHVPGRVVNVSSISGLVALPLVGPYAMSKHALEAFTDALRREIAPWGIPVVAVEPGTFRTPVWAKARDDAGAMRAKLPPAADQLYGALMTTVAARVLADAEAAPPPDIVAQTIAHALSTPHPRTRYVLGAQARVLALAAWLLPDRALDWLIRRALGM